jgi:hypothetical protein
VCATESSHGRAALPRMHAIFYTTAVFGNRALANKDLWPKTPGFLGCGVKDGLVAVAMRMLAAAVRILPLVVEVGWAVQR